MSDSRTSGTIWQDSEARGKPDQNVASRFILHHEMPEGLVGDISLSSKGCWFGGL